jgi:hypothetical protein
MTTEAQDFIIRPIRKDEKRTVVRAVNRSLRLVERSFFSFSDDTYVAEQGGSCRGLSFFGLIQYLRAGKVA